MSDTKNTIENLMSEVRMRAFGPNHVISDRTVLEFIEAAVIQKLKQVQMDPGTYRPFETKEYQRVVKAVKELWDEDEAYHGTHKIYVIKRLRDLYGYRLKECKRLVEEAEYLNYIKVCEDGGHRWYEVQLMFCSQQEKYRRLKVFNTTRIMRWLDLWYKHQGYGRKRIKKQYLSGFNINITTKLGVFYRSGLKCAYCNRQITYFALERYKGQKRARPHLNGYMYIDGKNDLIFNVDHIIPIHLGGDNYINNYTTACYDCNLQKEHNLPIGQQEPKEFIL